MAHKVLYGDIKELRDRLQYLGITDPLRKVLGRLFNDLLGRLNTDLGLFPLLVKYNLFKDPLQFTDILPEPLCDEIDYLVAESFDSFLGACCG